MPKQMVIKKKELTRTKSLIGKEIRSIREDKVLIEKMDNMRKKSRKVDYDKEWNFSKNNKFNKESRSINIKKNPSKI